MLIYGEPIAAPLLLLPHRFSRVRLCATPWTAAYQASPPMGFSRQEHWSGLPDPLGTKKIIRVKKKNSKKIIRVERSQETLWFNPNLIPRFCLRNLKPNRIKIPPNVKHQNRGGDISKFQVSQVQQSCSETSP